MRRVEQSYLYLLPIKLISLPAHPDYVVTPCALLMSAVCVRTDLRIPTPGFLCTPPTTPLHDFKSGILSSSLPSANLVFDPDCIFARYFLLEVVNKWL